VTFGPPWLGRYTAAHILVAVAAAGVAFGTGHVAAVLAAAVALGLLAHLAGEHRVSRLYGTEKQEAEARYRTLVEQLPLITYVDTAYSTGESRSFVSPQIETILGYTQEEWSSVPGFFLDHLHPEDRERVRSLQAAARETGDPLDMEYRFLAKDGRYVWLWDSYTMVRDGTGAPAYSQGFALDITVQKQARQDREAMLKQARVQNERLLELDRVKDEFIALVSHELRTPLTSIRGYLELVSDDAAAAGLPAESREWLGVIDRNADRLLSLVEDLLISAEAHSGSLTLTRSEFDVGKVVRECAETCAPTAAARRIRIDYAVEAGLLMTGDPGRIGQVVDNLVSNALKFTPAGGHVELVASRRNGSVLIEVADTGMGIPADEQDKLFDRFFRTARVQSEAIAGAGLGLSIAKAIVEAHRGHITCRSVEGEGTTFAVELPIIPPERRGVPRS
jgi:PAS domain S-box-containing protein